MSFNPIPNPLAVTQSGAWAIALGSALPTGANTIGAVTISGTPAVTLTSTTITGNVAITAASLPLPSGASTAANQSTLLGYVDGIEALLAGTLLVNGSGSTQPISAVNLPLPAGAATSAKQDTGNGSLSSIDGKIVAVNTGAVVLAAGAAAIGSVSVSNFPATQAVSLAALPALAAGTANIGDVDVLTLPVAFDTGLTTATTQRVVAAADLEMGTTQGITSLRDALVAQRYTVLADSIADGINATWTSTVASGGTTTSSSGEGLIQTSANASGAALLVSSTVNYFPGQVSWFNSAVRLGDTGSAGNIRRIGVFTLSGTTPQEGAYFELNGTTLNAVVVKAGTPTAVASTSWSRVAVAPFTLDTNYCSFEIRWTANTFLFFVNNILRHSVSGTATPLTTTLNFPMAIQSINTSGATNRVIAVRNCGIGRFGTPEGTKDNTGVNRVDRNFILDTFTAAPVADALQSVIQWYANAAVGATTQPAVVPAGKILRLTGGRIETKSLATVGSVLMRIRAQAAGLVLIGSPIVASVSCGSRSGATTVAMTGGHDHAEFSFGERGHELPGGTGVGFSLAGYGPTGTLALQGVTRFEVWGYEYTP